MLIRVYKMSSVVAFVIPVLEVMAVWSALPVISYVCEIAEDGPVLAGMGIELPGDDVSLSPKTKLFWGVPWHIKRCWSTRFLGASSLATAFRAVRFACASRRCLPGALSAVRSSPGVRRRAYCLGGPWHMIRGRIRGHLICRPLPLPWVRPLLCVYKGRCMWKSP